MPSIRTLTLLALFGTATPVAAETVEFQEGDVYCTGYEQATHSCAGLGIVRSVEDNAYTSVERAKFDASNDIITITMQVHTEREGEEYCMGPQGIEIAIDPEDAPMAPMLETALNELYAEWKDGAMCVRHSPCGSEMIAEYYLHDILDDEMSSQYRLFRADEPGTRDLALRTLTLAEALSVGRAEGGCAPET